MGILIGALLGAALIAGCSGSEGSDGTGGAAGTAGASTSGGASSGGASSGGSNGSGGSGKSGTGGSAGSPGSGGSPGGAGSGGASSCGCVEQTVIWNQDGGFVAYRETNTLEPCHNFTLTRDPLVTDPPSEMCTDPLDSCEGIVNPADIQAALEQPDVVAAFTASPILYGRDTRPVDGQVLQIHLGDQTIEIGLPCNGQGDCVEEPAGVVTLRTYLNELASQLRARPPCDAL